MEDQKHNEIAKKIAPAVHAFTQAMADAGLITSALIFNEEGDFLIRAGNAEHRGQAFINLHAYLALTIAHLDRMGATTDLSVHEPAAGGNSQDPAAIALALATACIQVPSELIPNRIRELAERYLDSLGN